MAGAGLSAMLFLGATVGRAARPECFVDLPVFDPFGNKAAFEIIEVQVVQSDDEEGGPNLLTSGDQNGLASAEGDRLFFPKGWLGGQRLLHVTLRSLDLAGLKEALHMPRLKTPLTLRKTIELTGCEQRTSLRVGVSHTNWDITVATIEGHISGCQLDSEWWIRAVPMFGGHVERSTYEGFIHGNDGSFSVTAHMRGERHILIVGRGKQPLMAIGVDVTAGGGKTDVGVLDLSAACRK
jgi:hypothetical protein